jgi:hypothetical protein
MRGCAHMWTRIIVADLSVWDMDFPDLRPEGENFVDSSLDPCVPHMLKLLRCMNTRPWLFSVPGRLVGLSYLIRRIHKSAHMSSQGCILGDISPVLHSCYWWSGGVLRRHHGRTVCRASLRAETRKQARQGLAIDSKRASVIHFATGGRCLVAQTLLRWCW